jgi:hypothetical protein
MKKGRQTWFLQPKKPRRLSPTQSRSSQVRQPLQDYIEFSLGFVVVLTLLEEEQGSRDTSQSREASRRLQQQVGQTEQPELEKTLAYLFEKASIRGLDDENVTELGRKVQLAIRGAATAKAPEDP